MIRCIVGFLLFFNSMAFSCSLCAMSAPRTDVAIHLKADKQKIKTAKITWTFVKSFSNQLLQLYDLNLDKKFDQKELKFIEVALLNYIEPRNFLTFISYSKNIPKKSKQLEVYKYKTYYKDGKISFEYDIKLDYKIVDKNILFIRIHDKEAYFSILFDNRKQLFNIPYKISKTIKPNSITYIINKP